MSEISPKKSVLIVGAGLTGLQTAYALREAGFAVELVERERSACQSASYSAAAFLDKSEPALLAPAASLMTRLRARTGSAEGLFYSAPQALRHPAFVSALVESRTPESAAARADVMRRLAHRSAALLREAAEHHGFALQESAGTLTFLDESQNEAAAGTLTAEKARELEPSLYGVPDTALFGYQKGASWSASYYAKQLRDYFTRRDVPIHCGKEVVGFTETAGRVTGVETTGGPLAADAVVLCTGAARPLLFAALNRESLPLALLSRSQMNVKLHDTAPLIRHAVETPEGRAAVPLDAFMRLIGRWQLGTVTEADAEPEYKALWQLGLTLFPEAADWSAARYLTQSILSTPDGLSLTGETARAGLFVNMAGGIHGADFCAAYAEVIVDRLTGKANPFKEVLSPARFI